MPALVCLGLRWRTGSDDFVVCGIIFAIISFVVGIIGIIYTTTTSSGIVTDASLNNNTVTIHPCAAIVPINDTASTSTPSELIGGLEDGFMSLLQAQCYAFIAVALSYAFLAITSSIGTIMEPKRREPSVPVALTLTGFFSTGLLVIGCLIAKRIHVDDELSMCSILQDVGGFHARQIYYMAHALAAVGITEFSILFLFFCMAIDGTRNKELTDRDSYHALWLFRMKVMCFCFGWRSSDKNNKTAGSSVVNAGGGVRAGGVLNGPDHRGAAVSGFDAFTDAADALAVVFEGLDLVPSDIAAGLLLLQGIQERRHRKDVASKVCYKSKKNPGGLALHRMTDGGFAEPPLSSMEPNSPLNGNSAGPSSTSHSLVPACGAFDRVSRQAQTFTGLSPALTADLKLIERYSNYFLGAYGWKLFIFGRLASGLPKLCANQPCFCCSGQSRPGRGTDCCGCDGNAMLKYTGLQEDEILLTSFKNEVFLPAFYVALEHVHSSSTTSSTNTGNINKLREASRKAAQTSSSIRGANIPVVSSALKSTVSALGDEDFTPSMCVADDDDRAVVIAIRGSMSLEDCVTDANAVPAPIEEVGEGYTGPLPAYCHGGMLRCAERILIELEINGILGDLVGDEYSTTTADSSNKNAAKPLNNNNSGTTRIDTARLRSRKIVVLGHSLGAGTAVILSILLRQRYPSLIPRLQCIAYAPPGGLLTAELSEYTKTFVVGTFMGCDVIPRLAVHTLTELRSSMLHALAASKQGKTSVLCQFLCPTKTETLADEIEMSSHAFSVHSKLLVQGQAISGGGTVTEGTSSTATSATTPTTLHPADFLLTHKLYPPAKLVHFVKAVSVAYSFLGGACVCDGAGSMLCGSCCCPKEDVYYPTYINPGDTQEIICSPYMGLDHLPDRFYDTMHDCFIRMRQCRLDELVSSSASSSSTAAAGAPSSSSGVLSGTGNNRPPPIVATESSSNNNSTSQPIIFRHQGLTRVEDGMGIVNRDNLFDVVRRPPATPTTNTNTTA